SLHATKVFGVGEGGLLLSGEPDVIQRAQQLSNFGIYGDAPVDDAFGNFKMSEYSAAVGLAFLDIWPERRRSFAALTATMRAGFESAGALLAPGFGEQFVSSTCMISIPGLPREA